MFKYLLLITLPSLILTWWDVGHMLTAAIAEIRLKEINPYALNQFRDLSQSINQLCDNRTRSFIESAVWPDDIKARQYSMDIWNPWHFIDTPYVSDATIPVINYTESAITSVIVTNQAKQVLSKNINKNTVERALFSRYLIHLVGDIHQPLHSVSLYNHTYPKGDAGGNFLKIELINGSLENFHSFWDSGAFRIQNDSYNFVRPLDMSNSTLLKKIAEDMKNQYGAEVEGLSKIIDPAIWAKESFLIAQNTTYPRMMQTNEADETYTNLVYETSRKRITLAGYRLAEMVNNIYGPITADKQNKEDLIVLDDNTEKEQMDPQQINEMFQSHALQNKNNLFKLTFKAFKDLRTNLQINDQ